MGPRGSLFFWLWVYNKIIDKISVPMRFPGWVGERVVS